MERDRVIDNICENKVYKSYCKYYKIENPRYEDSIKGFFLWLIFQEDARNEYNKEVIKNTKEKNESIIKALKKLR